MWVWATSARLRLASICWDRTSGKQPKRKINRIPAGAAAAAKGRLQPMTGQSPAVVSASKLGLTFQTNDGPVQALSNVDLNIGKGEFVSFIGPSGCGKTTLLRVIADLEKPTSGSISVNGMTPEQAREKRAYGYVFQAAALFPWRTIERNVALPLEIIGLSQAEQAERIKRTMELVDRKSTRL